MLPQTKVTGDAVPEQNPKRTRKVWHPKLVQNIEATGLSHGFLADLALKIMYFRGQVTGYEVANLMRLPFQTVVRGIVEFLKREQLCEVRGAGGLGPGAFQYIITTKGAERAREKLDRTTYAGPAPVPWTDYVKAMRTQGRYRIQVNEMMMRKALSHLVLNDGIFSRIGPAVNSGKSLFLYGPPGNGKTTIAESVGRLVLGDDMFIPFAVEIDGQIVKIFDEINHVIVEDDTTTTGSLSNKRDTRWVKVRRPVIMVGGELTLDGLDLVYDSTNKYYEAPYQMKANGGMFLIDDFGRQQVRPRDLLNRWIVPMEKGVDFLALHTGRKIEVPFEVLIVFSTNLPPRDLVDEAFLRRIRHKIEVASPNFDELREIFMRMCKLRKVNYEEKAIRYLVQEYYIKPNRSPRASHPRDILDQLIDIAAYLNVEPRLTKELIDQAASAYFVDLS